MKATTTPDLLEDPRKLRLLNWLTTPPAEREPASQGKLRPSRSVDRTGHGDRLRRRARSHARSPVAQGSGVHRFCRASAVGPRLVPHRRPGRPPCLGRAHDRCADRGTSRSRTTVGRRRGRSKGDCQPADHPAHRRPPAGARSRDWPGGALRRLLADSVQPRPRALSGRGRALVGAPNDQGCGTRPGDRLTLADPTLVYTTLVDTTLVDTTLVDPRLIMVLVTVAAVLAWPGACAVDLASLVAGSADRAEEPTRLSSQTNTRMAVQPPRSCRLPRSPGWSTCWR